MKNKLITLLLIIVLILSIAPLTYATEEDNVNLTTNATTVNVGDTVTATLTFAQKVQAADLKINFPSDMLTFKTTSIDEDYYTVRNNEIQYCIAKNSGVDSIVITFEVIKSGNVAISTNIEKLNVDTTTPLEFTNKTVNITANELPSTIDVTSVTLNKTTASIEVGATTKLTATVLPTDATDKTVTWSSSDTSVATVSNGTVTGKKAGTATITATAGSKSVTCTVTVTEKRAEEPEKIDVTSITLNETSAVIEIVDTTFKLTATILPANATDKTIIWSSSDESVATVSNGKITPVKEGTTIITAKVGNKSATCEVTIIEKRNGGPGDIVEIDNIKLNKENVSLSVNEKTKLIATITPENISDDVIIWSSSDTSIVTVLKGTITGLKEGKATITAKVGDKVATCNVTVTKASTGDTGKVPDKETTTPSKDTTTSKNPIPQAGETYVITGSILVILGLGIVSIVKYRRYRDI